MPDILQTRPADWKYVSEGGANIVFSYKGPSCSDFDSTVLRLRKVPLVPSSEIKSDPVATSCEEETDDPIIEFQAKCMRRLIPPEHLPRLQTVLLSRPWLEMLVESQDHLRPESRRQKDQVDLTRRKGVLATDLITGNWLAVEIKPKWGFLPSPIHLSEETKHTKTQTCRFCLHSHFRARKGHQAVTNYCPLDLFSGDENRLRQAIYALWDAWVASDASGNNLKIFAGGKCVRPSEVEELLAKGQTCCNNDTIIIRDVFAESMVRPLMQTRVLRILSDLQRNLDVLDIEGLSKLWKEAELAGLDQSDEGIQISDPGISDWIEFLDTYTSSRRDNLNYSEPSPKDLRYYLLAYCLSATFKDCSIVVRLDFLRLGDTLEHEGGPYSVVVIDLDPKSMDKLRTWQELDREIVTAYSPAQRKVCIDANHS